MGRKDIVTKEYLSNNKNFADMFNMFVFNGEQVIDPSKLKQIDPTELFDSVVAERFLPEHLQKNRDLLKTLCLMSDDKRTYMLLGIENQSQSDLSMVIRIMLYDALRYYQQISEIKATNKDNKIKCEFVSGLTKHDKLLPVVTLVINWGSTKWSGYSSLYDMFDISEDLLPFLSFVPNYKLNLFDPHDVDDEIFNRFKTELNQIFKYIKYSKDKTKLENLIVNDEKYSHMDVKSVKLINAITGSKIPILSEEGEVDMCKAIENMINDARIKEKRETEQRVKNEAREEMIKVIRNLLSIGLDISAISKATNWSVDTIEKIKEESPISAC